jgi:hypothetical protein
MPIVFTPGVEATALLQPLVVTLRVDGAPLRARKCPELWTDLVSLASQEVAEAGARTGPTASPVPRVAWHAVPGVATSQAATEFRVVLIPLATGEVGWEVGGVAEGAQRGGGGGGGRGGGPARNPNPPAVSTRPLGVCASHHIARRRRWFAPRCARCGSFAGHCKSPPLFTPLCARAMPLSSCRTTGRCRFPASRCARVAWRRITLPPLVARTSVSARLSASQQAAFAARHGLCVHAYRSLSPCKLMPPSIRLRLTCPLSRMYTLAAPAARRTR